MRVSVTHNRFSNTQWNVNWLSKSWDRFTMPPSEYYIYLDDNTELVANPGELLKFEGNCFIGAAAVDVSIHDYFPDCDAKLGFPYFYPGFFVLVNNTDAQRFLDQWKLDGDLSLAISHFDWKPNEILGNRIRQHVPIDAKPKIIWRKDVCN